MPSEQLFFIVGIVIVLGFAAWMIWMKYQDKWRTEDLAAKRLERESGAPQYPGVHKDDMMRCTGCSVQFPVWMKHCPNCGKVK